MPGPSSSGSSAPSGPPGPHRDAEVTQLLDALRRGETDSDELFRRLYSELHAIARRHRARWSGNETINTTALVHEAYLKLMGGLDNFENRSHVLGVASRAMRQVLVSYAESQRAQKRGGGVPNVPLDDAGEGSLAVFSPEQIDAVAALDEALDRLARADERAARVVECRFFGGLSIEETAEALDISTATVTRTWRAARAWLYGELKPTSVLAL